jgi:hypothetical protein
MERDLVRPVAAKPVALPPAWRRGLVAVGVAGVLVTALGLLVNPARAWPNVLLAAFLALGLALGGLLFVAFAFVTKAGWSVAVRRVPEAMAATLPVGIAAMVVALLGAPWLYEWSHADAVAADHLLQEKSAWLNVPFFASRAVLCFVVWLGFAAVILRLSRRQDERGDFRPTRRNVVWSTLFLVAFALTFSAAAFDWIMSLEPHWFSTVFALYHITGLFLAALAATTVLVIVLRRLGPFRGVVRADHRHDLGRLTLGFATFWAYLWYSQHMLIWYGNIPEETSYYVARLAGAWGPLLVLSLVVNWLVPFLVLLPRTAKRNEGVMLTMALLLLAGRWLDLYLGILPPFLGEPGLGPWEVAPVAAALSLTVLAAFRALARHPVVPAGDPYLVESL